MLRLPVLLALLALAPPSWAALVETERAVLGGSEVWVDVYRPASGEPIGVAIVAHGFTRDRTRHRDLARELAHAGIVAIVPDLPSTANHWGNGDALAGLVRDVERGTLGLPPTPRSRVLLIGTSAGGLATALAAAELPGLGGWIGLDPVDRTGTGARAAARLTAPSIVMLGDSSSCNLFGSGHAFASASRHLVREEIFPGASHCDFESPTTRLCRSLCGQSKPGMDEVTRTATVTAALDLLSLPASTTSHAAAPIPR
jgi:dienelactone hydrolase